MSLSVTVYSVLGVFYIAMGIFTYTNNKSEIANKMFLILSATLAYWALTLALMSVTENAEVALLYRRFSDIARALLFVEILNYVIIITNYRETHRKFWYRIFIYTPAIICFCIYFFDPLTIEHIIRVNGSWAFKIPNDRGLLYSGYFNFYFSSYMIVSIIVLFKHSKTAKYIREKKRSLLIFKTLIIVTLIAIVPDVILPRIGYTRIPPVTVVIAVISIIGVWVSMRKYSLMNLSGDNLLIAVSKIMPEGIIICDNNNKIIKMNTGAEKILGFSQHDLLNNGKLFDVFPKEIWETSNLKEGYECAAHTSDGSDVPIMVSLNTLMDDFEEKSGVVIYFQDITNVKEVENELIIEKELLETRVSERTKSLESLNKELETEVKLRLAKERKIKKMAYNDHLTGLPNRRMFSEYLKKEIEKTKRSSIPFAILFIDLDGFKNINDSLGHSNGDLMLIEVSKRLVQALRKSDIIARLGGDEFAILLFNPADFKALEYVCTMIISEIEKPYYIGGSEAHVSASIGVSICPSDSCEASQLLKNADIAMYNAKENGKGNFSFYDKETQDDFEQSMRLTNDLFRALENNELEVYYQPQIKAANKCITGFEALLRWNHPELGLIMPGRFISIAENTGLINPIGKWVLEIACKQLKTWNEAYNLKLQMAVNLSPKQLEEKRIIADVIEVVENSGINPEQIELEITETTLMKDINLAINILTSLKEIGIKIAIDDYGTEYSSLSYIKHLSVNRLKIPKSFVDGICESKNDETIITSTILLAKDMGMDVVAEGVEEEKQYQYLKEQECDIIQGYLFYRPMPAIKINEELRRIENSTKISIKD